MQPTIRVLEPLTTFTPLGIRFWDPVTDQQVSDGLIVTLRPAANVGPIIGAVRTATGIYAFQGLPGLRAVELPAPGQPPSAISLPFVLNVDDTRGRFTPVTFEITLPQRGIYPARDSSGNPPGFFLFSAPTRPPTPGVGVVRAQLMVKEMPNTPAVNAAFEVRIGGKAWFGIADENGSCTVLLPYPTFAAVSEQPRTPMSQRKWRIVVRVHYKPSALITPPGAARPDVRSILTQPNGKIWSREAGPPVNERQVDLFYDQELVLRTDALPSLLISPAS